MSRAQPCSKVTLFERVIICSICYFDAAVTTLLSSTFFSHFDILFSIFCPFDILSVDILRFRYFAFRCYAIRYFATSIFCLSITRVRYFAIRYFVVEASPSSWARVKHEDDSGRNTSKKNYPRPYPGAVCCAGGAGWRAGGPLHPALTGR